MTAAPWTSAAPPIASPRRWQVAASLWAIPPLAVWLQAVVWPESLTLLRSWLAGDPTLLLALLLIAASELLALLVVIFQVGSRGISLRRFALYAKRPPDFARAASRREVGPLKPAAHRTGSQSIDPGDGVLVVRARFFFEREVLLEAPESDSLHL